MSHYRKCPVTGKRSYPSKTEARRHSRGPRTIEKCEHCKVPLLRIREAGPGWHVTRAA